MQFARDVGATQLILGVDPRRARGPFRSGTTGAVVRAAGALEVHLVPVPGLDRFRGARRRRGALSPRRRVLGWVAAVVLPPVVTVIGLAAGDLIGPTSAALVFMLAVVGVALIGGIGAAVLSAVGATVLLNYFFTPPLHSFAVVEPQHLLALVLLLLAAVLVALVVHNAARRGQQAVRARAEAALLTDFAITVMTEPDPLRLLLEKVREAFAATSVALLERDRDGWRQVAAAGSHPAAAPERAEVDVAVDDDLHVVLSGRLLSAAERHVLRGVAGQALLALRAQRLAAEAIEAQTPGRGHRAAQRPALRGRPRPAHALDRDQGSRRQPARSRPGAVGRRRGHPAGDGRGMRGPVAGAGGQPARLGPAGRRRSRAAAARRGLRRDPRPGPGHRRRRTPGHGRARRRHPSGAGRPRTARTRGGQPDHQRAHPRPRPRRRRPRRRPR